MISEWLPGEFLLTTALTDEKDFHLNYHDDPWDFVQKTITNFTDYPEGRLIFVGVPRLYKYLPLFCSALFHELGHFIDLRFGVTDAAMLAHPVEGEAGKVLRHHRQEYFADLLAACYVGRSIAESLQTISPDAEQTYSHPATAKRLELIEDFLTDKENGEVDMWRDVLARLKLPDLKPRFATTNLVEAFDDIRPVPIGSDAELFGLFPTGWSYMVHAINGSGPEWSRGASQLEIVRIVSDLTEKSIRNASIRKLWGASVA